MLTRPRIPPRTFWKRLGAVLWRGSDHDIGFVVQTNGIAAIGLGILVAFWADGGLAWALAAIVVSFLALTVCVLYQRTVRIAMVVGAPINGALGAFVIGGLSTQLHPKAYWIAGPLGFALGVAASAWGYRDASRIATGEDKGAPPMLWD